MSPLIAGQHQPAPEKPASIAQDEYRYLPHYLDDAEATVLFERLLRETGWRTETLHLFGAPVSVPRLVAWHGDPGSCYRYSKQDHTAEGWPDLLLPLRERIGRELGALPDFVLMNRYRNGRDSMGWHADDEQMAGHAIASVSLGAARRFLIRVRPGAAAVRLDLEHGSLLIMDRFLQHSLPRTRKTCAERINLTFRILE